MQQLARRYKEDSGTRVPLKTLTDNMQTAFDAMANAHATGEYQAAMDMMASIAQDMLEKSSYMDRERYDQYRDMRTYFHGGIGLNEKQWREIEHQYGSNQDFRQAIAGMGIKVLPRGSAANLDANWGMLCEQWPEFFSPDTNEGDQINAVIEAMDATKMTYVNPYGNTLEQHAADMAMDMYETYMRMPETESRESRQVADLRRQLGDMREKIRNQAQRRKDNQAYAQMRGQVVRQRNQLTAMLTRPKIGAFIPDSMHQAVTDLLRAIDFEGKLDGSGKQKPLSAQAVQNAKAAYMALAQPDANGDTGPCASCVNGDLTEDFDLLAQSADGKLAKELTMREMAALRNIVAGYTAAVRNYDRLFMQEKRETLSETSEAMAASMRTRREKRKQGSFAKRGADALSKGLLKPVTVFEELRDTPLWTVTAIRDAAVEWFGRDSLAGAAWDKSLPFATRVAAAEKNYVMKKQGDGRKQNTGIYYNLMLTAYMESGFGEDFKAVVDAAIRTGAGESITRTFKEKLRAAEDRIPQAAQALMAGNMEEYARLYQELIAGDIGLRAVTSMIDSELNAMKPKEEREAPTSEGIIAELQRDDVATDPARTAYSDGYTAAVERGDEEAMKKAVEGLRETGMDDKKLREKVKTTYQSEYCWAIWTGERETALKASAMMKASGVIGNDDLRAWTSSLNGSFASEEMYRLMKAGDGKQAHVIHRYLVETNSSAEMDKKLKRWCSQQRGSEYEESIRASLRQMGYSPSTIDSWFQ
ncbi:MAG: hypothetical protein ACI4MJ_01130 [Aristaeellaceae bacterium]